MFIKRLRLENFRNLTEVDLQLHPQLNFFFGDNGAGKTSILEAVYLLSRGRSFRTHQAEELAGPQREPFRVYVEIDQAERTHRLGLEREGIQWRARVDGQDLSLLSQMARHLPLVLLQPDSHQLVCGGPDVRRRFMDWGVFHVEPAFLRDWQHYSRALKQRNAALRRHEVRVLDSLDAVLSDLGERLDHCRRAYYERLKEHFRALIRQSDAEFDGVEMGYQPGWKDGTLQNALCRSRDRDLERGATQVGPHRADLLLSGHGRALRTRLSRGEQKNLAATLLLAQARLMACSGEPPLILLDDLCSEFDTAHYARVLAEAQAGAGQVWVTGVTDPGRAHDRKVFHVERGRVQEMI